VTRTVAALLVMLATGRVAAAQELEPGAYWPLPRGLNIVTAVDNLNWGDVSFDPALPVDEANATVNTTGVAFARAFSLAGRSANASVMLPVVAGHLEGVYLGEFTELDRFGLGDPRMKVAVNLYGAPAMSSKEFAAYRQGGIVGVSITVAPPLGEYDATKVINLGTNRWSFKPEIGLSRTQGQWVIETAAGVWLFTDNTNFVGGRVREQDPIFAAQVHVTYKFNRATWLAADANYYTGGRTTVGGTLNLDLQRNSRVGLTFSKGLTRRQAIRASVSRGAYTTIGADFTSVAVGYNFAWTQ
jgi:hypothetical protein